MITRLPRASAVITASQIVATVTGSAGPLAGVYGLLSVRYVLMVAALLLTLWVLERDIAIRREHWRVLLRARAVENQAYVVGVNRVGEVDGYPHSGDTSVVDPWGKVVATLAAAGALAGLVGITAGTWVIDPLGSVIVGAVAYDHLSATQAGAV